MGRMLVIAFAGLLASTSAALADEARPHLEAAAAAMAQGHAAEAAAEYDAAFAISHDAALFYEIGLSHAAAGDCGSAITAWERYLAEASPVDERRSRTERRIAVCAPHAVAEFVVEPPAPTIEREAPSPPARLRGVGYVGTVILADLVTAGLAALGGLVWVAAESDPHNSDTRTRDTRLETAAFIGGLATYAAVTPILHTVARNRRGTWWSLGIRAAGLAAGFGLTDGDNGVTVLGIAVVATTIVDAVIAAAR